MTQINADQTEFNLRKSASSASSACVLNRLGLPVRLSLQTFTALRSRLNSAARACHSSRGGKAGYRAGCRLASEEATRSAGFQIHIKNPGGTGLRGRFGSCISHEASQPQRPIPPVREGGL